MPFILHPIIPFLVGLNIYYVSYHLCRLRD